MNTDAEVAVTLPAAVYNRLRAEARRLGISLEWIVADLIAESLEEAQAAPSAA